MATLNPAPDTLGLASPALGPWFRDGTAATPTLEVPLADLSVEVSLPSGMEWRAPAGGTLAYAVASSPRPAVLAALRQADGAPAFAAGSVVLLFTLLPEVELRLAALSNVIPTPDGQAPPTGAPGRPPVRHLALVLDAADVPDVAALQQLRAASLPAELTTDEARATYLGLKLEAGVLGNAARPIAELHRPNQGSAVLLKNGTGATLDAWLWAFDDRGRALDPGAVANWWGYLASTPIFDNLWAHSDSADQRTATVDPQRSVLVCNPHEGPLPAAHAARLVTAGLTAVAGTLYSLGTAPSITITPGADADSDILPLPRLAMLPHGNYGAGGTALFSGWTNASWPTALTRDFARVALADIESHLVGADRSGGGQADPRLRVIVARNTATTPVLTTTDAAATQLLATLGAGAAAMVMAPVMDSDWGALVAPSLGSGTVPDSLQYTVHALRGEGTASGGTAGGQKMVVRFPAGSLPANAWVRVWTQGLDTSTGLRFRQDGGAGRADASGRAFVVTALPDGTAAPDDPADPPVRMGFDALVVTEADPSAFLDADARYYLEQRFDRPALVAGDPEALPPTPGNLPSGLTAWVCEQGAPLSRALGQLGSGQTLLAVPDDEAGGAYALVDRATLDDTDLAAGTLRRSVGSGDRVIVTVPAFGDTPEGDVIDGSGPVGSNGATVVRRTRSGLVDSVTQWGRPVPTQERREVAALDPATGSGALGATPGRAASHEAVPSQLAHPGVPAAAEVHGTGASIAGPLGGALAQLMRERAAVDLPGFVGLAQQPLNTPADPGGTSTFGAVLETLTYGVTGDASVRAYLAALQATGSSFQPGQRWTDLKASIEGALSGVDLDPMIDSASFDDDTLATAFDRAIVKTRDGAAQAATALQAAIARAEDFVYLETPALDALASADGSVDLLGALTARLAERPGLAVLLCVPQKFLPGQPGRLETLRRLGIGAALKALRDAAPDNVVLFSPTAGSGRALHMASTTVIVDDSLLLTGSTHLWRRGLSFDSSLALALFDETVARGRGSAVRTARRQLLGDRLALPPALVPDDPRQLREALARLNEIGGLLRVLPNAYPADDDPTSDADLAAWNPDGRPGGSSDWFLFFAALSGQLATDIDNASR